MSDRSAMLVGMTKAERKNAWRESNRAHVAEYNRRYKVENRALVNALARTSYRKNTQRYRDRSAGYRAANAGKVREAQQRYRDANRDVLNGKERERKIGVTLEQFTSMIAAQGGVCGACKSPFEADSRHTHADHDHRTGKFRGVLCRRCNLTLGYASDDIGRLEQLIAYLRSSG